MRDDAAGDRNGQACVVWSGLRGVVRFDGAVDAEGGDEILMQFKPHTVT
jgi:hypothetical protein